MLLGDMAVEKKAELLKVLENGMPGLRVRGEGGSKDC